jgi:23S rRNA pseudouridine1911/1915/1917 synthase
MPTMNQGHEYKKKVGAEGEGYRVVDYLARYYPACTAGEWLKRIEARRVLVDGIPARQDQCLKPGQLLVWIRPPWMEPDVPCSFAVLYRDRSLLAAAKPSGLPTLPGGGMFLNNTLLTVVRRHFPGANPLHRLGRATSGIVLFALTQTAAKIMLRQWSDHKVLKIYRALVSGKPGKDEFDINIPIGTVHHGFLKNLHAAAPDGKPAYSHVTVLERRESCTLVQVRIRTGRPHQIRIHMAAAGFPLVGDPLYASGGVPEPQNRSLPSASGYHLHNALIGIRHPDNGRWMEITCMPPPMLRLKNECNSVS